MPYYFKCFFFNYFNLLWSVKKLFSSYPLRMQCKHKSVLPSVLPSWLLHSFNRSKVRIPQSVSHVILMWIWWFHHVLYNLTLKIWANCSQSIRNLVLRIWGHCESELPIKQCNAWQSNVMFIILRAALAVATCVV